LKKLKKTALPIVNINKDWEIWHMKKEGYESAGKKIAIIVLILIVIFILISGNISNPVCFETPFSPAPVEEVFLL